MSVRGKIEQLEKVIGAADRCEHEWPQQHLLAWPGRPDELVGRDAPCAHVCRRCGELGEPPKITVQCAEQQPAPAAVEAVAP